MSRKNKQKPLNDEQVLIFWEAVREVVKVARACEDDKNWEAYPDLLQQLYHCGVSPEEFNEFAELIKDAGDPDMRCPQ